MNAQITFDKEVGVYVSKDTYLGVFSQGVTEERAQLALEDAVRGFLFVAYKYGMLEDIMDKCRGPHDPTDR